jgi:hypothetical protein
MASDTETDSDYDSLDDLREECDYKPDDALVSLGRTPLGEPMYCAHSLTTWCALCYGRFTGSEDNVWFQT